MSGVPEPKQHKSNELEAGGLRRIGREAGRSMRHTGGVRVLYDWVRDLNIAASTYA